MVLDVRVRLLRMRRRQCSGQGRMRQPGVHVHAAVDLVARGDLPVSPPPPMTARA